MNAPIETNGQAHIWVTLDHRHQTLADEVGRWIDPEGGSNSWGVHVDEVVIDGEPTWVITATL